MCDTATVSQSAEHQKFNWRKCLIYVSNRSINTKRELNSVHNFQVHRHRSDIRRYMPGAAAAPLPATCTNRLNPGNSSGVRRNVPLPVHSCHSVVTWSHASSGFQYPASHPAALLVRRRTSVDEAGCGTGRRFVALNIDGRASI